MIRSASGGFFLDGVQLVAVENSLRVHVQIVLQGAMPIDSVLIMRKLSAMLAHSRNLSEASETLLAVAG